MIQMPFVGVEQLPRLAVDGILFPRAWEFAVSTDSRIAPAT